MKSVQLKLSFAALAERGWASLRHRQGKSEDSTGISAEFQHNDRERDKTENITSLYFSFQYFTMEVKQLIPEIFCPMPVYYAFYKGDN